MQSFDTESPNPQQLEKTSQKIPVCPVHALPPGACKRLVLPNGGELAIFNVDGEYYAIDNFCPHRGAALSDGDRNGHVVECGLHGWQFDVRSGECLTVPERIKTFGVLVSEEMIVVEIDENVNCNDEQS